MKLLLSGFEPFLNNKINPSFEVLKKLPKDIDVNEINIIELPVTFNESFKVLEKEIKVIKPDIVISFGLAAGREAISLESTAYNLKKIMLIRQTWPPSPLAGRDYLYRLEETHYSLTLKRKQIISRI